MTLRLPKGAFAALSVVAVLTFAPAGAFAEPTETEETDAVDDKDKAKEKKICKRISAQAGSRRKTKVCRTREEWKTFNQDQRRRN